MIRVVDGEWWMVGGGWWMVDGAKRKVILKIENKQIQINIFFYIAFLTKYLCCCAHKI
jgi:hypothetical protein